MVSAAFKYVPQTTATTFALSSVFILLLCTGGSIFYSTPPHPFFRGGGVGVGVEDMCHKLIIPRERGRGWQRVFCESWTFSSTPYCWHWPYKEMLTVQRLSAARPAGRVRCWQVKCREAKTGQQEVPLSSKTNHLAHLGIINIWHVHTHNVNLCVLYAITHVNMTSFFLLEGKNMFVCLSI